MSSEPAASMTSKDMDERLRLSLSTICIKNVLLPLEMGSFYQRYILHRGEESGNDEVDVRKSSYKSVGKWLSAMEREGLIRLKKKQGRGRKNPPTKYVVAIHDEQLKLLRKERLASLEQTAREISERSSEEDSSSTDEEEEEGVAEISEDLSSTDEEDQEGVAEISISPSGHARRKMRAHGISEVDVKRAIAKPEKVRRAKGVKFVTAKGTTAIITAGQKNRVISAWKEKHPSCGSYNYNWTSLVASSAATEKNEDVAAADQQIVTVLEMCKRYTRDKVKIRRRSCKDKSKQKKSVFKEGTIVRKGGKAQKIFLVLGLPENALEQVVKQISNQIGTHIEVGNFCQDDWESIVGENCHVPSEAVDGSKYMKFSLALGGHSKIKTALKHIEACVPDVSKRRYLIEEHVKVDEGHKEWMVVDKTAAAMEAFHRHFIESILKELVELYETYEPESVDCASETLERCEGEEQAFLDNEKQRLLE